MIQKVEIVGSLKTSFKVFFHFVGDQNQWYATFSIYITFQSDEEAVRNSTMHQSKPRPKSITRKAEVAASESNVLGKNNVHRNNIRIETINTRRKNDIEIKIAESFVVNTRDVIRKKEPDVREQVRLDPQTYFMPGNSC